MKVSIRLGSTEGLKGNNRNKKKNKNRDEKDENKKIDLSWRVEDITIKEYHL